MSHRKDLIDNFNDDQRKRLAGLMREFLNDRRVAEHISVFGPGPGPDHIEFFPAHRAYIEEMETFLMSRGGQEFVPLPKWDDARPIPSHFRAVKERDNGIRRPELNPFYEISPRHHPLPATATLPKLCEFVEVESLVHEIEPWHVEVHALLGGVMALSPREEAAAALIFWPWHAFNDEIYHQWEICKFSPTDSLTADRNADGRLELFVSGKDTVPWHCWQRTNTYAKWSRWVTFGGGLRQIAAIRNADGRIELFGIGAGNSLWHIWQTSPGGGWSNWHNLGGTVHQIAVGRNADGRLEVFGIDSDNALYNIWQRTPNGQWSDWNRLGGSAKQIALGQNVDGRLEVFAIRPNNELWHTWQTSPNNGWSNWRMHSVAGISQIVVGSNADGRLEVFGINLRGGNLLHGWQTRPSGNWVSAWQGLSGRPKKLAVGRNADGRLEVFAIGQDDKLSHIWQTVPNADWSQWSAWALMGERGSLQHLAVASNDDGRLEIFAATSGDAIWHIWQTVPNGGWSRWQLL